MVVREEGAAVSASLSDRMRLHYSPFSFFAAHAAPQTVMTARHMTLPASQSHGNPFPTQIVTSAQIQLHDPSSGHPQRPPSSTTNSSEDEIAVQKSKKKGVMSLFKRNK